MKFWEKSREFLKKNCQKPKKKQIGILMDYLSHISRNSPKKIDEEARDDLIRNINSLKL